MLCRREQAVRDPRPRDMMANESPQNDRMRRPGFDERGGGLVLRIATLVLVVLTVTPAFGQSGAKYQVGTITEVKPHTPAGEAAPERASYDVSVRVGDTIYVVLYNPPMGETSVKYAAGRDLLVLVGKKTITYNDILGRPFELPIEGQKPAPKSKQPS